MPALKLGIIGASELQNPLIKKAEAMGIETHVFAWQADDIGERTADYFYPISIVEKKAILDKCREIGIDGICTIASDLANVTVGYVAHAMGLPGNSPECIFNSTNKQSMRKAFRCNSDPSPKSISVHPGETPDISQFQFPIIVKPVDRSGSRGVTKLASPSGIAEALNAAFENGFEQTALVEEFIDGDEYSFEYLTVQGKHTLLAATQKFTTGAPHFIEKGHLEPAPLSDEVLLSAQRVLDHALDSLGVTTGASHAEMKIDANGRMGIVEIGSRMGGDCIGSDLVELTTGVDYVAAVIDCALGREPGIEPQPTGKVAAVKYLFDENDLRILQKVRDEHPDWIVRESRIDVIDHEVVDSSTRFGFFIIANDNRIDCDYASYLELA